MLILIESVEAVEALNNAFAVLWTQFCEYFQVQTTIDDNFVHYPN